MQEHEQPLELDGEALDPATLAPVARRQPRPVEDDEPVRAQDPWASAKGLAVLFLGVVGVLLLGWGSGMLAMPGSSSGAQECARTCESLGTQVASFDDGVCVCTRS